MLCHHRTGERRHGQFPPDNAVHARARFGGCDSFFEEVLGFRTLMRMRDYAYLHRETGGMRILESRGPDGAPPRDRRFAYYVDVHDVDALYAELKPKLNRLPKGDVHGPADKDYDKRELLVLGPTAI